MSLARYDDLKDPKRKFNIRSCIVIQLDFFLND